MRAVKDEVELVEHFALIEFQHGSVERGRTMMEGVLREHPKRLDVWLVWADAELKAVRASGTGKEGVDAVRRVLDRALEVKCRR